MSGSKQQLGGMARAAALSPERRREIASAAGRARHLKPEDKGGMPKARSDGFLMIGAVKVDCYVLHDGRRLVSKRAMARALGLRSEGGNALMKTLTGKTIGSAIPDFLWEKIENPILFSPLAGDPAHGYEATVLIDVCDALIEAKAGLVRSQQFLARQAETIIRASAKVGITALIDEATGFIEDKRKEEYRELWADFIREECRKWEAAEFPEDIFDIMYKLYGLKRFLPDTTKHPRFFAKFLRKYIWYPLANSSGAILEELEAKNPVVYANGGRRYKLFQFLTDEIGLPELRKHIWKTVGIGLSVQTKEQFDKAFYAAFPKARPIKPGETADLFEYMNVGVEGS